MPLNHVLQTLQRHPAVTALTGDRSTDRAVGIEDIPEAVRPLLAAAVVEAEHRDVLIVTTHIDRAWHIANVMQEYVGPDTDIDIFPAPDAHPFDQIPDDPEVRVRRMSLLADLRTPGRRSIVVAPVSALLHRMMPPTTLDAETRRFRPGDIVPLGDIRAWSARVGYRRVPLVQEQGEIAFRGSIIDVFPPAREHPVRLDLFDTDLESIREFDVHTQRSRERMENITLLPTTDLPLWELAAHVEEFRSLQTDTLRDEVRDDWLRQLEVIAQGGTPMSPDVFAGIVTGEADTLLGYVPEDAVVVIDQPDAVDTSARSWELQATDLEASLVRNGEMVAGIERPVSRWDTVRDALFLRHVVTLGRAEDDDVDGSTPFRSPQHFAGRLDAMADTFRDLLAHGWRVTIATDQVERLSDILEERNLLPRRIKSPRSSSVPALTAGTIEVQSSGLDAGWVWPDGKIGVWTDLEIFGFRKRTRRTSRRTFAEHRTFATNLAAGEHVVHVDHGISRFVGLTRMENGGVEREYLLLEFDRGDKLYVPIDQSDRVSRYSGGGQTPSLNRLGSGEWQRARSRVRRAVREMAFELIQLYARRDNTEGHAFPPDTAWDIDLAESFPWKETVDQTSAIDAVTSDMEEPTVMDRLVCGDVGFGKTEVAIRAAFKAVNNGKQVAVLVPTTVLALQHHNTFRERLAAFPVRIDMLSRLRGPALQRKTLAGLADGSVDIVIGTHRLVQSDIRFKDLGLVIIDEEQRFGVRHKEFLKQRRIDTDVLTLSATPIPRTLHLSLAGIRDISMIETAPQARLPIRTFVAPFSDHLIREAVLREMDRGGQIYFVHNRVHDIDILANRLRRIVPDARIGIGHGQMDEQVLENVMLGFYKREFDILLATTIIESGVDNPDVNTIIIDNADTLGLTQLYQLRGRVGRSTNRAYAYLLHQPGKPLRVEAQERLEVIQEANELGAGIRVAMRDLEIRGAGNILGAEQSGHISTVGYDLYMRLLSQAVEEVRSGKPALTDSPVTLDLPLTALIPEEYVPDTELRLRLYHRIAAVDALDKIEELRDELTDRFGDPPVEIEHLLALIRLRIRAAGLGIESVVERERQIILRPIETSRLDVRALERRMGDALKVTKSTVRIDLMRLDGSWQAAIDRILDSLEAAMLTRSA